MGFNANNMCDRGIQDVIENIGDAIQKVVKDSVGELPYTNELKTKIVETIVDNLDDGLESELQDVVQEIDNHMEAIKDESIQSWLEYQEDYVHVSDISSSCEYEEMESEKDEKIEELEEKVEELEGQEVVYKSLTLTWVPGREKFICTVTGRVFELKESEDNSISMVQ